MPRRTREEMEAIFKMLDKPDASSRRIAAATRPNSDSEYDGDDVRDRFSKMLSRQGAVMDQVHKKFEV